MNRPTLGEIFAKYGCDKGSKPAEPWMASMGYERVYEPLLAPLRDEPITMLELGWGEFDPAYKDHSNPNNGGRSAAAWREYFSQAEIHSLDIEHKINTVDGITLWQGSQDDPKVLQRIHDQANDFDLIIDDASHVSSLTIRSFEILWPMLKPGGLYVVEDLHTSFHPWYFGPREANEDPGNLTARTAVNFFRRLATEPFYRGTWVHGPKIKGHKTTEWDCYPRKYWQGYQIESISFCFPQIIVIRKAR
jgi:8-demethyl-8-(2-methoxy-alpha-L-rhamnosyl)tetracenomycin-C 3'-O-methyltransferase